MLSLIGQQNQQTNKNENDQDMKWELITDLNKYNQYLKLTEENFKLSKVSI